MMGTLGLELIATAQHYVTFWQIVFVLAVMGFFVCIGRWLRDGQ
jgi:hypothetical protein